MHSRLLNIWKRQISGTFGSLFSLHAPKASTRSRPSLLSSNQWVSLHRHFCSTKSSDSNLDLNDEIKLDNITVNIGNPAVENIDYDTITDGDPELLSKLKLIVLETDSYFQDGHNVPSQLRIEDWKNLLTLPSRSQRQKLLNFLFKKEMIRANEKARKEANKHITAEKRLETSEKIANIKHIYYGLRGNTLFHRIYDSYMNMIDNMRAMNSIQLGPDIIVDLDYYDYMNLLEQNMLAKQLLYIISENRTQWEPYNVIFSSYNKESHVAQKLNKLIENVYAPDFPFNYTSKHFTELNFKRSELVYLTPHTNNVLLEHTPGSVYIIGGMVDKRIVQPLSLAKAKKENIRAVKLPLDNFLDWGSGNKSLTLNQVMAIMNDWRRTNDWNYSFRHIPRRKLNREFSNNDSYLARNLDEKSREVSAKFIKERKKRQLVYDLLLKR